MTTREDSSRQMLAIYFRLFDSESIPAEVLANPAKVVTFCDSVRHEWGIQVDDSTILAALKNAITTVNDGPLPTANQR
jgi:hypothetical protein